MAGNELLQDRRGRPLRDLRISVMDKCNFRCPYCMPQAVFHDGYRFLPADERLSFEEIERVARVAARLGVTKLRLTGGEPLLRPELSSLIAALARVSGITDIALTTNGALLARHAQSLRDAGLHRVTISLDSLDPADFAAMSGGHGRLDAVLAGIDAAGHAHFPGGIKVNAVIQRGVNDASVLPLLARFRGRDVTVRLFEYVDVGNRNGWNLEAVVPSVELREKIAAQWPIEPISSHHRGEVATRWRYCDGAGEIGFISSVSAPFCGDCTRARLSSDGKLYTCLFATKGTDLRALLRSGIDDTAIEAELARIWGARDDRYSEARSEAEDAGPEKVEMFYIGG